MINFCRNVPAAPSIVEMQKQALLKQRMNEMGKKEHFSAKVKNLISFFGIDLFLVSCKVSTVHFFRLENRQV